MADSTQTECTRPECTKPDVHNDTIVRLALLSSMARPFANVEDERRHLAAAAKFGRRAVMRTPRGAELLNPPRDPAEPIYESQELTAAKGEVAVMRLKALFDNDRARMKDFLQDILRTQQSFESRDAERDFLAEMHKKHGMHGENVLAKGIENFRNTGGMMLSEDAPAKISSLLQSEAGNAMLDIIFDDPAKMQDHSKIVQPVLELVLKNPLSCMELLQNVGSIVELSTMMRRLMQQ